MGRGSEDKKLTLKEREVLDVFLNADTPLTASEVHEHSPSLNANTIQAAVRSLLKAGYIEVTDIVYSGTVLCRRYGVTDLSLKAAMERLIEQFDTLRKHIPTPDLIAILVEKSVDKGQLIAWLEEIVVALKDKSSARIEHD